MEGKNVMLGSRGKDYTEPPSSTVAAVECARERPFDRELTNAIRTSTAQGKFFLIEREGEIINSIRDFPSDRTEHMCVMYRRKQIERGTVCCAPPPLSHTVTYACLLHAIF